MTYFNLFKRIFYINTFTFGGGYTIIPIIESVFVDELKLIEKSEMRNIVSLANTVPGALAISTSFLVGYKVKGTLGAIVAVLASVSPCIIIIALVYSVYENLIENIYVKSTMKGIGVAVSAILLGAVVNMFKSLLKENRKYLYLAIFTLSFILSYFLGVHIVVILILASILGSGII
ncbi:chromate transporter [Oceanivirga miroungae]|uniref:Chromate transporter n=1 Tax=Oceanivirga miroungae TaxID=1130046 RepID=A0A6I8M8C9_9FUSO|nr:chromate transporter [Oceanivirga miroungae]VWL85064.1 chromate transporter [Oceanivirga miroungae]